MEPVRDYELKAFFTYVIEVLENLGIPYMVVGGFAAIFYAVSIRPCGPTLRYAPLLRATFDRRPASLPIN